MLFEAVNKFTATLTPLKTMMRVIVAIILRETKTRFGKNKLGYLWALIEPASYIVILLLVRHYLHSKIPYGENLYLFFLTGILVYRLFISISSRTMQAITSNQSLLTYPIVKPIDTIFARIILEALTMLFIFFVFFSLLLFISSNIKIHYPDRFGFAILATIILAAGVGTFNAVSVMLFPFWERFWSIIKFPLLIASGVFYMPSSMPLAAQKFLAYNPVLNCIEWLRYGTYLDYSPLLNEWYVVFFGLSFMVTGMFVERLYRNILVRG
ncbi:ABC transporter permease [Ochrobactrum sp. SD129]|nr:ABC transporter permease [Ochrobactrum sp. SD129]